ncbi:hypothetical protein ACQ4PT_042251 [Festuca glaucescens]
MDLPNLAVVLRAALSHVPEERKAAEESLNQFQFTPQHLVRLLQIIVDGSCDMAVRQVASIHFKNFVAKNWSPNDPDESQKVSVSDKSMVRENILGFIVQVPPLLRFKSEEDRIPLYHIVEEAFPRLLSIFSKLVQIVNPPIEVADLIKLICKIIWSSIYLEIPKQLFDPNVFNAWMILFINLLERPVPVEGQPIDPDIRKSWGWWKVKKWTIHILNRLYTRFGDLKLQKSESKTFAQMFQKNYAGQILGCHLQLLNAIRTGDYLPDRVTNLILQYLTNSITKNSMYQMMQPQINIILFEIIFPLMCFNDNDQKLWEEDPHEYVRKGYDIIEDLYSPRTAAMDFVSELAAWVAGQYAHINFSDQDNFRRAMHCIVAGMRDPDLPVRVDSVFALRSFVEACKDLNEIRPILPQLLDEFFKLMNEVENEDLVFTLETIVDKFGEEMAPYALGLCQNLASAFWKCMASSEADDEADDSGALAAVGCLRAISTILESVSSLPHLFTQIEPTLLPIMRRMLTSDGQDILVPLDNYVSRGSDHFLACKDPDYQQSLWSALSSIMMEPNMEDSDIEPAPKLIEVLFQNCKGHVDQWVEPYLRLTIDRLRRAEKPYLKCLLVQVIANALYYNPSLALAILHKLGVATEIFNLWFGMLKEVKKSGIRANFRREHDKKVCCLGLTSLIGLPVDHIPAEVLDRIFKATLELLAAYKDQVAESKKQNDDAGDDMDGFDADEDDNDDEEVESDKEMGLDDEDGDDINSLHLQKLAAEGKGFQPADEDDESDDDFSDDEELQSPIDEVDPFILFVDSVKGLQASDPSRFQNLMQTLDFRYQALANGIAQHAEERRVEIEKEKLEKGNAQ